MSIHTRKLKDVMPRQAMAEKMLGKALKYLGDDKDKNAGYVIKALDHIAGGEKQEIIRNWFHQWMRENDPGEYTDSIRGDVKPCIFCHFATDNIHDKSLSECLKSPFFKSIRARQPFSYNTLRPCPMIDHPQAMWQIIKKHGAKPTHEGADTMFTALNSEIHEYAERVRQVMDTAWEKEGYENWAPEWMHHCGLTDEQIERRRRKFEKNSSDHKTMPDQQAQAVTGYKR